jgi:hypothetical protein
VAKKRTAAATAAPHHRGGLSRGEKSGAQVQPQQPIVARGRGGGERRAVEDRGVVDEHIESAERRRRPLNQPSRRRGVGKVRADRRDPPAR